MSVQLRPSGLAVARTPSLTVVRDSDPADHLQVCRMCGSRFANDEHAAFERHIVKCGDEHADVIAEMSPRRRLPLLSSEGGPDPEREDWIREHADDILHGRVKMAQGGL